MTRGRPYTNKCATPQPDSSATAGHHSRLRLGPHVAVGEDDALADHVLGRDIRRAALRGEVNGDGRAIHDAADLERLAVLVGAGDDGRGALENDLTRAARVRRVRPHARDADLRDVAALATSLAWRTRGREEREALATGGARVVGALAVLEAVERTGKRRERNRDRRRSRDAAKEGTARGRLRRDLERRGRRDEEADRKLVQ